MLSLLHPPLNPPPLFPRHPQEAEARGDFAKAAEERALAQEAQAEAEIAEEDLADAVAAEQEIAEMSLRERLDPALLVEKIGQYGPNVRARGARGTAGGRAGRERRGIRCRLLLSRAARP